VGELRFLRGRPFLASGPGAYGEERTLTARSPQEVPGRRLKLLIPCLLLVLAAPLNAQDEKSEAMSAAPLEVAANATILDSKGNVIQEGTNGYTCFPTPAALVPPQPTCLDALLGRFRRGRPAHTCRRTGVQPVARSSSTT